jgi:diguanylate cyclase (GGDEF)-like protein
MTVGGSDAAIPARDSAWDPRADAAFLEALPLILDEVFREQRPEALVAAIAAGGEELVYDVTLSVEGVNPRVLAGRIFEQPPGAAEHGDRTVAMVELRTEGTRVWVPLEHAGVRLGEMVAELPGGAWIGSQQRAQLRRYGDLVSPLLYAQLEREELRRAALTDQLTGLANRRALDHELERLCAIGAQVSLLLLDLDGLKDVNDTVGYDQGDHLITSLARAIAESLRGQQVAARMGGDEFIVILPDATPKQARKLARRVSRRFARQPLHPGVAELSAGASIGMVSGRPGESPRDLVRRAARSMRSNKRRRRGDRDRDRERDAG